MIPVKRTPKRLPELEKAGIEERAKRDAHLQDDEKSKKPFSYSAYRIEAVKLALEKAFHGKCAYCESTYGGVQTMEIEHFRPKGRVTEDKTHPGYWWLASDWENLLPSCTNCNQRRPHLVPVGDTSQVALLDGVVGFSAQERRSMGKANSFPILEEDKRAARSTADIGLEEPLLLNPCKDKPDLHLKHYLGDEFLVSFLLPKKIESLEADLARFKGEDDLSIKGATSIHVYGLNRLGLVQERTKLLRRLEFQAETALSLFALAYELGEAGEMSEKVEVQKAVASAKRKVTTLAHKIVRELKQSARPSEPHSSLAAAWLQSFEKRLQEYRPSPSPSDAAEIE